MKVKLINLRPSSFQFFIYKWTGERWKTYQGFKGFTPLFIQGWKQPALAQFILITSWNSENFLE
jgi:hypothetical protein